MTDQAKIEAAPADQLRSIGRVLHILRNQRYAAKKKKLPVSGIEAMICAVDKAREALIEKLRSHDAQAARIKQLEEALRGVERAAVAGQDWARRTKNHGPHNHFAKIISKVRKALGSTNG